MTIFEAAVYAVIGSHAPSYWWSPANREFDGHPDTVKKCLDSLVEQKLLKRSGVITPLYALADVTPTVVRKPEEVQPGDVLVGEAGIVWLTVNKVERAVGRYRKWWVISGTRLDGGIANSCRSVHEDGTVRVRAS